MSLRPYVGEYLISPVPLHFGLNYCSHGCFYCFANLNDPARRADNTDLRWLAKWDKSQDQTLVGWLLAQGYPLLVSNDSDPLAASNEETFLELREVCARKGLPLCYQTKGGKPDMQDLLLDGPATMIYITITTDREDIRRQAEPAAPAFEQRLAFAMEAKRRGHHVVIGINPMVPEWWADFDGFCRRLAEAGIRHAWIGSLHLNRFQIPNIARHAAETFADEISNARSKNPTDPAMRQALTAAGINFFDGSSAETPGFWDAYFALGYPFFPTLDGWFAALREVGQGQPVAFGLNDFNRWADVGCPLQKAAFKDYLNGFGRSVRNTGEKTVARCFNQVHDWYFRPLEFPTVLRHEHLYVAQQTGSDGEMEVLTDAGRDILVYAPATDTGEVAWNLDESPAIWLEE